jgi:CBS domain-containing protein
LMSEDVTAIPEHMSLQGAAHVLAQFDISGAPVVDEQGRCIGVLSANDFVGWAEKDKRAVRSDVAHPETGAFFPWQLMEIKELPVDEVSQYMTADPVTARPATSLGELACKMRDAHIHRVIVVDKESRPIGIFSSTDVLAAVARNAERVDAEKLW